MTVKELAEDYYDWINEMVRDYPDYGMEMFAFEKYLQHKLEEEKGGE